MHENATKIFIKFDTEFILKFLSGYIGNMKYLGDCIICLPNNLRYLTLNL